MKAKIFALLLGWIGLSMGVAAQNTGSKMGSNPDECIKNYSLYYEFYKQKNYADALPWWNKTIAICPAFSKNLWIHGERMFKTRIATEKDPAKKEVLIDSLLWIYDQRIKYFGGDPRTPEGYVLGLKGIAIMKYRKTEYNKAYDILGESIKQMSMRSPAAVLLTYMQCSRQLFADGAIDEEKVLTDYDKTMEIVNGNLKQKPGDRGYTQAHDGIEQYFTTSGAATCESLVKLYTPKFEALKDNIEWLQKITRQLRTSDCADSRLFSDASEALFKLQPDAAAAHNLAAYFMRQEDYDKAAGYLESAIKMGQGSDELADMYYELAYLKYFNYKKYQEARSLALKAIKVRPNWGDPYILIGRIYVDARKQMFKDEFDQQTVFWVSVDKFIKAKSVDPEVTDKANELIKTYSQYFPSNEDVFFHTLHEGDSYKVEGWINETTKVRSRK